MDVGVGLVLFMCDTPFLLSDGMSQLVVFREQWRPGSESNRRTRICSPLRRIARRPPILGVLHNRNNELQRHLEKLPLRRLPTQALSVSRSCSGFN